MNGSNGISFFCGRPLHNRAVAILLGLVCLTLSVSSLSEPAARVTPVRAGGDLLTGAGDDRAEVARAYVRKAREAAAAESFDTSIYWYTEAVKTYPPLTSRIARDLGDQYARIEVTDSAIVWYNKSLRCFPDDVEALLGLARALSLKGRYVEALEKYRVVLSFHKHRPYEADLGILRVEDMREKAVTSPGNKTYQP